MPYKDREKQLAAQRAHYRNNKKDYQDRRKKRRSERREYIKDIKASTPCVDCGNSYHFSAMQFDHVRGKKKWRISQAANELRSWEDIDKEIAKCEIRCANCHAIRTWERGQNNHT